jgi:hypothetical protein
MCTEHTASPQRKGTMRRATPPVSHSSHPPPLLCRNRCRAHASGRLTDVVLKASVTSECFELCKRREEACVAWSFTPAGCGVSKTSSTCTLHRTLNPITHVAQDGDGACVTAASGTAAAADGLLPLKWKPLKLGTVAPTGWLRNQLLIFANGLSGETASVPAAICPFHPLVCLQCARRLHPALWLINTRTRGLTCNAARVCCSAGHLDLFWHDVNQSVWIGGTDDKSGAGHERGPCKSPCPAAANTRPEHAIQLCRWTGCLPDCAHALSEVRTFCTNAQTSHALESFSVSGYLCSALCLTFFVLVLLALQIG